jgi:hypothetical protein
VLGPTGRAAPVPSARRNGKRPRAPLKNSTWNSASSCPMLSKSWRQSMALSQSKDFRCFPHQATHIGRLTSSRSERQYKYRFKRWGFEKNIPNATMRAISSKNNGRLSLEQKETVFRNHDQPIHPQKIRRWEQRYNSSTADGAQSSAPTPPGSHTTHPPLRRPLHHQVCIKLPIPLNGITTSTLKLLPRSPQSLSLRRLAMDNRHHVPLTATNRLVILSSPR